MTDIDYMQYVYKMAFTMAKEMAAIKPPSVILPSAGTYAASTFAKNLSEFLDEHKIIQFTGKTTLLEIPWLDINNVNVMEIIRSSWTDEYGKGYCGVVHIPLVTREITEENRERWHELLSFITEQEIHSVVVISFEQHRASVRTRIAMENALTTYMLLIETQIHAETEFEYLLRNFYEAWPAGYLLLGYRVEHPIKQLFFDELMIHPQAALLKDKEYIARDLGTLIGFDCARNTWSADDKEEVQKYLTSLDYDFFIEKYQRKSNWY